MEENANDIMETISDLGRILFYVFIGMAAFFIKRSDKSRKKTGHLDFPNAEPEPAKQVTEPPKPKKKPRPQPQAATTAPAETERRYFTYENETDYQSRTAERKEQTEKQNIINEEQGSNVDFDLRAAVIASEILKPKFED